MSTSASSNSVAVVARSEWCDDGIRLLLTLDVPKFDRRFAAASDEMAIAADPSAALVEMERFLEAQPEFWPALFLKAMGKKRLGITSYSDSEIAIDFPKHEVFARGIRVELSPTEFRLLTVLTRYANQVMSQDRLLDEVWGKEYVGSSDVVLWSKR